MLEKGQFFKTKYQSKLNYVVDKFIDEETGQTIIEVANPLSEVDGMQYYVEEKEIKVYKASMDFYDLIEYKDLLLVYIDDLDYITQVLKEEQELVVYIKGKRYTLEDLKQLDAINTIYSKLDLLSKGLNIRDLEEIND